MMTTFKQNTGMRLYLTKIPLRATKVTRCRDLGDFLGGRYINATLGALGSCMHLLVFCFYTKALFR